MELWIKHQYLDEIVKVNSIKLDKHYPFSSYNRKREIVFSAEAIYTIIVNNNIMGTYTSKEKAEEVFNEIKGLCCIDNNPCVDSYYEMPKE